MLWSLLPSRLFFGAKKPTPGKEACGLATAASSYLSRPVRQVRRNDGTAKADAVSTNLRGCRGSCFTSILDEPHPPGQRSLLMGWPKPCQDHEPGQIQNRPDHASFYAGLVPNPRSQSTFRGEKPWEGWSQMETKRCLTSLLYAFGRFLVCQAWRHAAPLETWQASNANCFFEPTYPTEEPCKVLQTGMASWETQRYESCCLPSLY